MGSPTIFAGKYTKLLTQKGLMQKGGAVNQFDGDRNYILNSTFESNTDDGWNRVKTTITSNLPTGTPTIGKLLSVAPSISSFGPYSGSAPFDTYSLFFGNVLGTVVAGEGIISDAFTVEPGDLGKVLTFKLYYKSDFGASTDNWSGVLGSQTWAVYIYDQSANGGVGQWLQPAGFLGMNQNSGVGIVSGTFQSSVVSGQQYRIAVIALKNTTSTSALQIDNVYVGSQTAPIGPVVTDPVDYVPTYTGFGTVTQTNMGLRWWRSGANIHIQGDFTIGTVSAATAGFTLPNGWTTNIPAASNSVWQLVGKGTCNSGTNPQAKDYNLIATNGSNVINFSIPELANTTNGLAPQLGSVIFQSNNVISVNLVVQISGWSSNVQLSNDTDTRVVAFVGSINSQAYTSLVTNLAMTVSKDSHGTFSSGIYTIPVSGDYSVNATVISDQANFFPTVYLNGSIYTYGTRQASASQATTAAMLIPNLKAGDTISLRIGNTNGNTIAGGYFSVNRLSGPSVVAASESVSAAYYLTAAQNISASDVQTIINFNQKDFDSHNAVTIGAGWKFTAPVSGKYRISTSGMFNSAPWTAGNRIFVYVLIDGSTSTKSKKIDLRWVEVSASPEMFFNGSTLIDLIAGQYIQIAAIQSNGSAKSLSTSGALSPSVEIERVGN